MATVGREHCCPANRGSDGFERWGTTAMLPKCGATECIEEDFQGRIGIHFMQGFAFVLEDFFACHVFVVQHATWPCRAYARPDPLVPAVLAVVRQKPGQRRWSDVRWPCRAVLPVFAVVSRWGQAGEKFQANHRPPGSAAGTRHMEKLRLRLGTSLGDKWTRLVTSLQFWIF